MDKLYRMVIHKVLYVSSKNSGSSTSNFNVEMHPNLEIDMHRKQVLLSCLHVEFKNNIYNVSELLNNNRFRFYDSVSWHEVTIPDGVYTPETITCLLDSLNGNIKWTVLISRAKRINVRFLFSDYAVDFTESNFGSFLGFENIVYPPNEESYAGQQFTAPNIFQRLHLSLMINCSLSNTTSSLNGYQSNIVDSVSLTEEQISYTPTNIIPVDISGCIGSIIDNIQFWLSDQYGNIISLGGEDWSGKFLIEIL